MAWKDIIPFRKNRVSVKRGHEHPITRLRNEMDALFDDFWGDFSLRPFERPGLREFYPKVDVVETEKAVRISAELPGMDENDIEVTINKESLVIQGQKKEDNEERGKDYFLVERFFGSFNRTVPLPAEVQSEKAEARFKKGVLTVNLPKSEEAMKKKKKIAIKVE